MLLAWIVLYLYISNLVECEGDDQLFVTVRLDDSPIILVEGFSQHFNERKEYALTD